MTHDDFLPYILPNAKGLPEPLAVFNARMALIELCQKALLWRAHQEPVTTVADQTGYTYAPTEGQRVYKLLSLKLDGSDIGVTDPRIGMLRDASGSSQVYAYGGLSGFELRPAQAADLEVITFSVVMPSMTAATIPDIFADYAEQVSFGVLARVLAQKDKTWSDQANAVNNGNLWRAAIGRAKTAAFNGHARVVQRTAPNHF